MWRIAICILVMVSAFAFAQTHVSPALDNNNVFTGTNQFTLGIEIGPITFSQLTSLQLAGATLVRCVDCQQTNPCTAGGAGAFALYAVGAWSCTAGTNSGGGGGNVPTSPGTGYALTSNPTTGLGPLNQLKPELDVRDYGVDCTDTTDSTTALQNMINAAVDQSRITLPEGCKVRVSNQAGHNYAIIIDSRYGLEFVMRGRQQNGCDATGTGGGGSFLDYQQGSYAAGNMVVYVNRSQRLGFHNFVIYTNGYADYGFYIAQVGSTPPITTADLWDTSCVRNGSVTRNANFAGWYFTGISNIEGMRITDSEAQCSSSPPTSESSNGYAIRFQGSANMKNEVITNAEGYNCSTDVDSGFGSANTIKEMSESNAWHNASLGGFNDSLQDMRSEAISNSAPSVAITNSIGPHLIQHDDFASNTIGPYIDCTAYGNVSGCGAVAMISNEADEVPSGNNWFNNSVSHGGSLFAVNNRFFAYDVEDFNGGSFVINPSVVANASGNGMISSYNMDFVPSLSYTAVGANESSPLWMLESSSGSGFDPYYIQSIPTGNNFGVITNSTLLIGHNPGSTIIPWLAFPGNMSGITLGQMPTPATFSVSTRGTAGSTSYTYELVFHGSVGVVPSGTVIIHTGNATLTSGNYNLIQAVATAGCTYFDVYRTAGGSSQGKISSTGVPCYSFNNNGLPTGGAGGAIPFSDTGLAGDSSSPPASNTTGQLVSTVSTGLAPFVVASTTPVANLTLTAHPQFYEAGVLMASGKIYTNTQALTTGTATHTLANSFTFTGTGTFGCTCTDQTAANACQAVPASATTVTLAGTSSDVLWLSCSGH